MKLNERTGKLNMIGVIMCSFFSVAICGHILLPLAPIFHCCMHLAYIIMAPIVFVIVKAERVANRENKDKLDRFLVINECADNRTWMDIDKMKDAYDQALEATEHIDTWIKVTFAILILEFFFFCFKPISLCLSRGCKWGGSGGSYARADEVFIEDANNSERSFVGPRSRRGSSSSNESARSGVKAGYYAKSVASENDLDLPPATATGYNMPQPMAQPAGYAMMQPG